MNGTSKLALVTWGAYTDEIGVYQVSGTYEYPQYVSGTKPAVTLTVNVLAEPVPLTVESVEPPTAVSVDYLGTPVTPSTIILNISDGTTREVAVTWGAIDTSTPGQTSVSGAYDLPSGISGDKPAVSLTVTVGAAPLTITGYVAPMNISTYQYAQVAQDKYVTLNISDGTTRIVTVTWGPLNTSTPGSFTITGSYAMPSGITGSPVEVSFNLLVAATGNVWDGMADLANLPGATTGTDASGDYVDIPVGGGAQINITGMLKWMNDPSETIYLYVKRSGINLGGGYPSIRITYSDTTTSLIAVVNNLNNSKTQLSQVGSKYADELVIYEISYPLAVARIYGFAIGRGTNKPSWGA